MPEDSTSPITLTDRALRIASADSERAYRRGGVALAIAIAAILGVLLFIGCPIIGHALHDSIWIRAEGEQIVAGQAPHFDYFAFHGIAPFLLVAAGIHLVGCRGLAITAGYAAFAPLVVAAGWWLGRRRLAAPFAALVALMLGVVLMSTSAPGGLSGSHAMIYNRFGWVMLSLVALQALVPPQASLSTARVVLEGALAGAAIACLEFTKLNYFAGGWCCWPWAALFPHARRSAAGAVLGLLAGNLFFLAFLRFNPLAYWNDVTTLCAAVGTSSRLALLRDVLVKNIPALALACAVLAIAWKLAAPRAIAGGRVSEAVRAIVAALGMLGLGLLVCIMNHQELGVVPLVVATVALAEVCRRQSMVAASEGKDPRKLLCLIACLAAVLFFAPVVGLDLAAIGLSLQKKVCLSASELEEGRLHSATLADFIALPRGGDARGRGQVVRAVNAGEILKPHYMAVALNDGIDLLRPFVGPRDRVYCLDLDNLFPLALGIPYAPGDAGWHPNMGAAAYPDPERFLAGMTLIMQPKQPVYPGAEEPMRQLFGSIVGAEFTKAAESEFWIVWRRDTSSEMMFQPSLFPEDLQHVLAHTGADWEELRGQRLLVTGGTGFFGKWLIESFLWANEKLGLGARMLVLSRDPAAFLRKMPHLVGQPGLEFHAGDVATFEFSGGQFSHVIHAATAASALLNAEAPLTMVDTIVAGTRRTLDFARRCGARKFLLTSSGAVYGQQPAGIDHVGEEYLGGPDPLVPASAYGEGKRLAEHLCCLYARCYGMEVKISRGFAFVGPYLPLDAHFAVGNFIRDALAEGPVMVGGDGSPLRSYLYAADLAVWLWKILFHGISCRAYNTGSDREISIAELARTVAWRWRRAGRFAFPGRLLPVRLGRSMSPKSAVPAKNWGSRCGLDWTTRYDARDGGIET